MFESLSRDSIPIDVLINSAGTGTYGTFVDSDRDRMSAVLELNVLSLTALTHLFLKPMLARGTGRIINVASIVAYYFSSSPCWAAYAASKAYVLSIH